MVKRSVIVSIIVIISIIAMGILFIFGDTALRAYLNGEAPRVIPYTAGGEEAGETGGAGGTSSTGAGEEGEEEAIEETDCRLQQIQYSLKKFVNDIECTNMGVDGCVELFANCSVEVYNLDEENEGIFGIEYSLIDSQGREIDSELIQRDVVFNQPEVFSAIFAQSNLEGVDENLNCSFIMQAVPMKRVCD